MTNIEFVKKLYEEKGEAVIEDLQAEPLSVLKKLLVESEGHEGLTNILTPLVQSKSFMIERRGDGIVLQPDTGSDTEWILNADGLIKKNGETTNTFSFSDEWVRVCNGINCSEVPLVKTEAELVNASTTEITTPEHDVPNKPQDTLELLGSISIPKLKATPISEA
jgi:hypothetical protein